MCWLNEPAVLNKISILIGGYRGYLPHPTKFKLTRLKREARSAKLVRGTRARLIPAANLKQNTPEAPQGRAGGGCF